MTTPGSLAVWNAIQAAIAADISTRDLGIANEIGARWIVLGGAPGFEDTTGLLTREVAALLARASELENDTIKAALSTYLIALTRRPSTPIDIPIRALPILEPLPFFAASI